jgi:hypothetical protein
MCITTVKDSFEQENKNIIMKKLFVLTSASMLSIAAMAQDVAAFYKEQAKAKENPKTARAKINKTKLKKSSVEKQNLMADEVCTMLVENKTSANGTAFKDMKTVLVYTVSDNKTGFGIISAMGIKKNVLLKLIVIDDAFCLNNTSTLKFEFTDGTSITMPNAADDNCDGYVFTGAGPDVADSQFKIEALITKMVAKISVIGKDGKTSTQSLTQDQQAVLRATLKCLAE